MTGTVENIVANAGKGRRMAFEIESEHLGGVVILRSTVQEDGRGYLMETYRADEFARLGLPAEFVQDNHSRSRKGVLRGLHFQVDPPQGKLMRVTRGRAFCVAVDVRKGSPTVGQWHGLELSEDNKLMVWAPGGFARGFCALSDWVEVQYKCTGLYHPAAEVSIRWDDPVIGIAWPAGEWSLSEKDRKARTLEDWLASPEAEKLLYAP